eukprot:gene58750-78385_t
MNVILFGWTLWLVAFVPALLRVQGDEWAARVTATDLQQLAAQLRISLIVLLCTAFGFVCVSSGVVQAQLDVTVATIVIPTLFVSVYLLAEGAIQAGVRFLAWGIPVAWLGAWIITSISGLGGTAGRGVGGGSVILVFLHLLSKLSQIWGEGLGTHIHGPDGDGWFHEEEEEDHVAVTTTAMRDDPPL